MTSLTRTSILYSFHPGRDERSPEEIIALIAEAGGDPGRTIIGHLERTVMDRRVVS